MSQIRKKVALFFGGRSPEHDVSVVTGLQILSAIDQSAYDPFPVYISPDGRWYIGEALKSRDNYLFDRNTVKQLTQVTLDMNVGDASASKGRLLTLKKPLLGSSIAAEFDIAIPAFHGLFGEDGCFQGLMECAGIPYVGTRVLASSVLMDKVATKQVLQSLNIPVLPYAVLKRSEQGYMLPKDVVSEALRENNIGFPCILKPAHLGSSIGIAKVENVDDVIACLPAVFQYDDTAIMEPFVPNLVEYNVAVSKISGEIRTSAIERPKATEELLDFKQKYLSGGGSKGTKSGTKSAVPSEGMLSLTRELNPKLPKETEDNIQLWAKKMFEGISGTGAPRIDFIGDSKSGEVWLNEVNPFPGSIGYFLWEAAPKNPLLFSELMTGLLEEALKESKGKALPRDPVPADARLLRRPL